MACVIFEHVMLQPTRLSMHPEPRGEGFEGNYWRAVIVPTLEMPLQGESAPREGVGGRLDEARALASVPHQ